MKKKAEKKKIKRDEFDVWWTIIQFNPETRKIESQKDLALYILEFTQAWSDVSTLLAAFELIKKTHSTIAKEQNGTTKQ